MLESSNRSGCIPFVLKTVNNTEASAFGDEEIDFSFEPDKNSANDEYKQLSLAEHKNKIQPEGNMEKTRTDILIEKSKNNYNCAIKIIGDMYDEIFAKNDSFNYTRKELFVDYDCYLQAILLKLCSLKDKFTADAMRFIENIADHGKLVEGTDFNLFADCAKEMRDVVCERADERLKEVPVSFKLAGAVDSSKKAGITKALLDYTVKIAFNLKFTDPTADVKNNSDIISSLKAIYVFATANGIDVK